MKKKLIALLMASAMVLGLAACGNGSSGSSDTANGSTSNGEAASTGSAGQTDTEGSTDALKVGFVYIGDESDEGYTYNFVKAQHAVESTFGDKVECVAKYNVGEDASCTDALVELCEQGCDIIFATSFGFEDYVLEVAPEYPDVQFCHATGYQCALSDLPNVHNYFAEIYQGRYLAGVVAGLKMEEMINDGIITADQAKVGYVGAYAFAEVISGYTAFYLGVQSVVPTATMEVTYVNSWGDYESEYQAALSLIDNGCVIISQHSDTTGPSAACEQYPNVYHVGYNTSMIDTAPNSSLVSSRIDWAPYEISAVQAVMDGTEIQKDTWAGLADGWVQLTELNTAIIAEGTEDRINETAALIESGDLQVFKGDFTATNANGDTIDLNEGYVENATASAPSYDYVLNDVITVLG